MNYKLHSGVTKEPTIHFWHKVALLALGAVIGFTAAVYVAYADIQNSVQPITNTGSLQVQPVEVQSFSDLTEPNDIQPALGVDSIQPAAKAYELQPALVTSYYQPAARYGVFQHTVLDSQLQGEPLHLN